ncbi:MAG: acyltransferase family protein [Clostridia bacterium]|nr:acyltransferase family protein [Clostridia bacterium]
MGTRTNEKNRVVYLDILRIIGSFAIIFLHLSAQNWDTVDVNSRAWSAFNAYDGALRWAIPVFAMISGALFLGRDITTEKLYKKHVLKIVMVFMFWSLFYALYRTFVLGEITDLRTFATSFVRGHYHMWFLYMIAGLYIMIPILRKVAKDVKCARYFVILAFVFAFTLPFILDVVSLISPTVTSLAREVINYASINLVLGYTGFFMLGYLLNRRDIKKSSAAIIYLLGIVAVLFTVFGSQYVSVKRQSPSSIFYYYTRLNAALPAIAAFVFAKRHLNFRLNSSKGYGALAFISKCTLGIYLIHPFVIQVMNDNLHINTLSFNAFASVPVLAAVIFLISLAVSAILNAIPFFKKWFV